MLGVETEQPHRVCLFSNVLVATGEKEPGLGRVLVVELQVETVVAGGAQQLMAPAAVEHPIGQIAVASRIDQGFAFGIEHGGRAGNMKVGGDRYAGVGKLGQGGAQGGAAAPVGKLQAGQANMAVVILG